MGHSRDQKKHIHYRPQNVNRCIAMGHIYGMHMIQPIHNGWVMVKLNFSHPLLSARNACWSCCRSEAKSSAGSTCCHMGTLLPLNLWSNDNSSYSDKANFQVRQDYQYASCIRSIQSNLRETAIHPSCLFWCPKSILKALKHSTTKIPQMWSQWMSEWIIAVKTKFKQWNISSVIM